MSILVFNAGSSTLKFALFDSTALTELLSGVFSWSGDGHSAALSIRKYASLSVSETTAEVADYREAVSWVFSWLRDHGFRSIDVVGHRVVHGGTSFVQPVAIDDQILNSIERKIGLAPLHNPHALAAIASARMELPQAMHVAVFDTAYFSNLPARATFYPVPYEWHENYGIRRYGFHGISHSYCAGRAAELLNCQATENLRVVVCHLGNGCSATAIRDGQPIATTMGFTPLEGMMMGTRSGSVDPGILLHLLQHCKLTAQHLDDGLNRSSGLLGISGVSSDFREVERAANQGNSRANLAIQMFVDRVRSAIGSLAVTLGGIDALIFTGGIGTHSASLRRQVGEGLECLNLFLDQQKNESNMADSDIAEVASSGRILVIHTREELAIARVARELHSE